MKKAKWLVLGMSGAMCLAAQSPRGTMARTAADQYATHAEKKGLAIGATVLPPKDAAKALVSEMEKCCMVVEVGLYPPKEGMTEIAAENFSLHVVAQGKDDKDNGGNDAASKPATPELVAKVIHPKDGDKDANDPGVVVVRKSRIGYQTGGVDPVSGQQRPGGMTTKNSGGVGIGLGGDKPPRVEGTARGTIVMVLSEKSLPEGATQLPVAGYLYFSEPRKKNVKYQLEYTMGGEKIVLPL